MSHETLVLLERLAHEEDSPVVRSVRSLLEKSHTRIDTYFDQIAKARDIEPVWRVRQLNAKVRRKRLLGIGSLVSALQASSPDRQVVLAHVRDTADSATLFFDAETNGFIGAVVVKMSAHTQAYYRGELKGDPSVVRPNLRKPAKADSRPPVPTNKAMA